MGTNVHTDNKQLVTQVAVGRAIQPADPIFLKPKGDPAVAPHLNFSTSINNPAGTVKDKGTLVATDKSYLGAGMHPPIVLAGRNTGKVNGDTGFLSFMKNVFIEGQNAVMHTVKASVNSLWSLLPPAMKNMVGNAGSIAGGLSPKDFADVAQNEAQAMMDSLMSTDTLIALGQTAALMGASAIPVVGQLAGGAAAAMRIKSTIEATAGAADEFTAMMNRWSQPMSPAQIAAERQKLASFLMRVGIAAILAALGKALPKLTKSSTGKDNSTTTHQTGPGNKPNSTGCACSIGGPVIIATGEKELKEHDFDLPGLIPLVWKRNYRSGDVRSGWFGQGWSHPLDITLHLSAEHLHYHDAQGRHVKLPTVAVQGSYFDAYEQFTVHHPEADVWDITFKTGITQRFVRPREDFSTLPLQHLRDRDGNAITLHYGELPDDTFTPLRPSSITDSVGRELRLQWNHQHQLTQVQWRADDQSPQPLTLAAYVYSHDGDLLTYQARGGAQHQYEWRHHVLVGYARADGQRFIAVYDEYTPSGRVLHSYADKDESGHHRGLRFEYLDRARATRITDNLGRTTLYEYDERRDIIATTGPDGVRISTPFDTNGHPRAQVDALGRRTSYRFDQRGNLTDLVDPTGATTHLDYNALDLPTRIVDALQHPWRREYDEHGHLIAFSDPLDRTTRYTYDARGLVTQVIDAKGGVKRLTWDAHANLTAYTDCSGHTTTYAYTPLGQLSSQTDALGHSTTYQWNAAGQLHSLTEPTGAVHQYQWSAQGRLQAYIDPQGATTRWLYNAHGEPTKRIDANGFSLAYHYDVAGRLTTLVNENGAQTHFRYDIADQLTDEIGFDGRHQRYIYNAAGELSHLIEVGGSDAGPGKVTHFERDALGRMTAKRHSGTDTPATDNADNADALPATTLRYDALGRLLEAGNPAALVAFAYDPAGQLLSETQTLTGGTPRAMQHQYDELGNRIRTQLPDGRALNWLFYGSGHLHQINLEQHGQHRTITDIERDALHRETQRSQGALTSHFDHDPMGRLTRHRATFNRGGESLAANPVSRHPVVAPTVLAPVISTPPGVAPTDPMGSLGQLGGMGLGLGAPSATPAPVTPPISSPTTSAPSLPTSSGLGQLGGGLSLGGSIPLGGTLGGTGASSATPPAPHTPATVDVGRQPRTTASNAAIERRYLYDASGQLTRQTDSLRGERSFGYDATGRILSAQGGQHTEQFSFDPASNLIPAGAPPQRDNRVTVYQDLRFEYDAHGNVITRKKGAHEVAHYTWNADHQLTQATVTRHGVTQVTRYDYDALGRRVAKHDAFGATQYLWDGDLMIQSQRGSKEALYLFEPDSFVPLATVQDGQTYWYQCDQIGTPQELTDATGEVVWAVDYKVWGEAKLRATGTDGMPIKGFEDSGSSSRTSPIEQPFRFQGQQFDEETGLHYNRFRYYDPTAGRFVSQDPIGLAGGINLQQYASDPFSWIDPYGLSVRKALYPTRVRQSTMKRLKANQEDADGKILCSTCNCELDSTNTTVQHNPPLVDTHNSIGYNTDQKTRNDLYNTTADSLACSACQKKEGGEMSHKKNYCTDTGPNFKPRKKR